MTEHDEWCDGSGSAAGSACCRAATRPMTDPIPSPHEFTGPRWVGGLLAGCRYVDPATGGRCGLTGKAPVHDPIPSPRSPAIAEDPTVIDRELEAVLRRELEAVLRADRETAAGPTCPSCGHVLSSHPKCCPKDPHPAPRYPQPDPLTPFTPRDIEYWRSQVANRFPVDGGWPDEDVMRVVGRFLLTLDATPIPSPDTDPHSHKPEYPSPCTGCEHLAADLVSRAPDWMLMARPSPDTDLQHLIRRDETGPYADGWNDAVRSIASLLSSSESTETPATYCDGLTPRKHAQVGSTSCLLCGLDFPP